MRKTILLASVAAIFAACGNESEKTVEAASVDTASVEMVDTVAVDTSVVAE